MKKTGTVLLGVYILFIVTATIYVAPGTQYHDYVIQLYYVGILFLMFFKSDWLFEVVFGLIAVHIISDTVYTRQFPWDAIFESFTLIMVAYVVYYMLKRTKTIENKQKLLVENLQVGFVTGHIVYDIEGTPYDYQFDYVNQAFLDAVGVDRSDVIGVNLSQYTLSGELELFPSLLNTMQNKTKTRVELKKKHADKTFDVVCYPNDEDEFAIIFQDVTQLKILISKTEFISLHDHLTGLPNRRFFYQLIQEYKATNRDVAFLFIDMNGLKIINDALGHEVGDQALIIVGNALKEASSEDIIPVRFGGDEFAVVVSNALDSELESLVDRILQKVSSYKLHNIQLSVSIGFAKKDKQDTDYNLVLSKAEKMMYRLKITQGMQMRNQAIEQLYEQLMLINPYESEHSSRTAYFAGMIATIMCFTTTEIEDIKRSALYHDIGKITLDMNMLNKPAILSPNDMRLIQQHAEKGYQILRMADGYSRYATDALNHHEWFNGKGYPNGLKDNEIPLSSRIIAVADAFEAMTSDRPYRKAFDLLKAIDELVNNAGTQFDPNIVEALLQGIESKEIII